MRRVSVSQANMRERERKGEKKSGGKKRRIAYVICLKFNTLAHIEHRQPYRDGHCMCNALY